MDNRTNIMDEIREYAAANDITISDACALHATAIKMRLYDEFTKQLKYTGVPVRIYTKDSEPVKIKAETAVTVKSVDEPIKIENAQ